MAPATVHSPTLNQVPSKSLLSIRQWSPTDSSSFDEPSHPLNQNALAAIIIGAVFTVLGILYCIWRSYRRDRKIEKEVEKNALLVKRRKDAGDEYRKAELDGEGLKREGEELEGRPIEVTFATDQVLELDGGEAGRELEWTPIPGSVRDV